MVGGREHFRCPSCGKGFTFWVQTVTAQPKVKCYFCSTEFHPRGEAPPQAPAPPPAAKPAPPAPAPAASA